jgi:phospholipase/carboxylesterase
MSDLLRCVEMETGGAVRSTVIWLHGLGADGHDFEPIVPLLGLEEAGVRFVFPNAPRRAVSINMGLLMPAWYDIRGLDARSPIDLKGIRASGEQVEALVRRENGRGVPAGRIVLAGFSQGGVVALHAALRHPERLAGVIALSTYFVEETSPAAERSAANRGLPIFQGHGTHDPMIPIERGVEARDRLLAIGHPVTFRTYPMEHAVHPEEIADVGAFLRTVLAPSGDGAGEGGGIGGGAGEGG